MKRKVTLLTPAIILAFLVTSMTTWHATPAIAVKAKPPVERHGQRGNWKYNAKYDSREGRIEAEVEYSRDSAAQLANLAAVQQQLAKDLVTNGSTSLDATIVFRRPLKQDEFEQFIKAYNVQKVAAYTLRYLSSQGERITINDTPTENELVPQDLLGMALQDIQQRTPGKLRGWVEVQATISADAYDSIRHDKTCILLMLAGQ